MKISKYFMVAAASIMMFGCAKNDENKPNLADEGPVALTINIADPQLGSKAAVPGTTATELDYDEIEVKLEAISGGFDWTTINVTDLKEGEADGTKTYTFYNIVGATNIEVRINADNDTDYDALETYKGIAAEAIPVHGSSSTFTPTGETAENGGIFYNLYETEVNVTIPVARLEFSGITHEIHAGGNDVCMYSSIEFDKIEILENASSEALLSETVGANFMTGPYPTEENYCYAFNIFPSMPMVRFVFTVDGSETEKRYAVVDSFKDEDGNIATFEAGKIYQVKDMVITDENLTPDPSGNTTVAVQVIVSVQEWSVVNTTVEFK